MFIEKAEPAARGFLLPLKKLKHNSLCDQWRDRRERSELCQELG